MTALHVIMYHYVRDLPRTPFPRLKGMLLDEFRRQIADLKNCYEMATLESAMDFLRGAYSPSRDLCLLSFDDGLKEHARDVTPLLADQRVQGLFFLIGACLEDQVVAPVHMNHFLMASLDFEAYRIAFMLKLDERAPSLSIRFHGVPAELAQSTYPWDTPEVARFKYFFNFGLDETIRDAVVRELFEEYIAPERDFADELYLSWEEARRMQSAGMVMGGHSHRHRPLASLGPAELRGDLAQCRAALDRNLRPQPYWPFSYPYGKASSYSADVVARLGALRFDCAFNTETGANLPGTAPFDIRRIDHKHAFYRTGGMA